VTEGLYLRLRGLLLDRDKTIRETIIRIFRYSSVCKEAFVFMLRNQIPLLVVRSLERDAKQPSLMERFQALKFIANWLDVDPQSAPLSFFQSLVAIASYPTEDQIRKPAIEILRKGSISCTHLCAWAGGLNVLIDSIIDNSCAEFSETIVLTFLYLINDPKTRAYLHTYLDLGSLFAVFTEFTSGEKELKKEQQTKLLQQLPLARRAVVTLMKNWSGLIYLTADPNGLRSLIHSLVQPVRPEVKRTIFDIFKDVLNINMSYDEERTKGNLKAANTENLLNTYMVMVLHALGICGIYNVLITLATGSDPECLDQAQQLLKKLMQLSSIILPNESQFLPLMKLATDFHGDPALQLRASRTLRELGDSDRPLAPAPEEKKNMSSLFLKSVELLTSCPLGVPYSAQLRCIWGPLRAELDYDMGDSDFASALKATNVLSYKDDCTRWDWRQLLYLFDTHLLKSVRMKEALKQKFFKPILHYFEPGKGKFLDRPWVSTVTQCCRTPTASSLPKSATNSLSVCCRRRKEGRCWWRCSR
jgi:rapamycin-insensitive companion of mTOR